MHKYKVLGHRGDGTFSAVLKAECIKTTRLVAIKCMKSKFENVEQVNRLREIQALRRLSPHSNVVKLYEVLYDRSTGRLALVFENMSMDLYELIKPRKDPFPSERVLGLMYQLCRAVQHMHKQGIFHRDLKPENILVTGERLKLTDFGSCRGIYSKQPFTEYIATRWYRAPECLLTDGYYNYKMDMWGIGCVFFEVTTLRPLFPGTNELDQLHKIHKTIGTPSKELLRRIAHQGSHSQSVFPVEEGVALGTLMPHAGPGAVSLLEVLLTYDPEVRITAKKALLHPYFKDFRTAKTSRRATQAEADGAVASAAASGRGASGVASVAPERQGSAAGATPSARQPASSTAAAGRDRGLGAGAGDGDCDVGSFATLPPILSGVARPSVNLGTDAYTRQPTSAETTARISTFSGSLTDRPDDVHQGVLPSISTLKRKSVSGQQQQQQHQQRNSSLDCLTQLARHRS